MTTEGMQVDRAQEIRRAAPRFRRRRLSLAGPRALGQSRPITEGTASAATSFREGLYRRYLALADAAAAAVVILVVLPLLHGERSPLVVLVAVPLIVVVNKLAGLYERDELVLKKTTLDEAPRLAEISGLFTFLVWLGLAAVTSVALDAGDVASMWSTAFALLVVGRSCARWLARRASAPERCLVIGQPASVAAVNQKLASGRLNVELVAGLELDADGRLQGVDPDGGFGAVVRELDVHRVIIAPAAGGADDTLDLIRTAKHAGVRISVVPRVMEVVGSSVEFDHVDGLTMLGVRRFGLTRSSRALKRCFDFVGASVLLAAVAPVMLAIMVAVRVDGRGPVFFRQTRVGKDGERFEMLKFRSMVADAEAQKDSLRALNETQGLFKIGNDPRITPVGRFLRRTSLDELPQLLNVWRGEMSLVGPRPLVVDEDAQVHGFDRHRLHLTPGMTGHWQILGTTRVPLHEMVGIDYLYVANWSLWTDVKIILRTVPHVLASRGL